MHASLCAWVMLCAQICSACFLDSIDTLISLIWPNLADIWSHACKHIGYMHAILLAWVVLCAQTGLVCFPYSIDTLIFLFLPNFACKHKACMHASLLANVKFVLRNGMLFWFHIHFDLSDLTKFGWDIGPCTQAYSVHACKLVCFGQIMCSERSCMYSWFHRYFDLSDLTQFGWDIGLCT